MGDIRERVRVLIGKFGSAKVAEVCGISELMLLRVGANAQTRPCVLVRVSEELHRLEGDEWAKEITQTRRVASTDINPLELADREVLVRNAVVTDPSLAAIVKMPGTTARDLCRVAPGVNVVGEVQKAGAWLRANPSKAKKNGARFLLIWVQRAQEKVGPTLIPSRGGVYGRIGPAQPAAPETRRWKAREVMPEPAASGVFPTTEVKAG